MKWLGICAFLISGCFYLGQNTHQDIVTTPSATWSAPELLTVIMESGNHNLYDTRTNIKVIATPYFPSVVKAIGRRAQIQYHWSEGEFHRYVDNLVLESCGMYIDWDQSNEPIYTEGLAPLESPMQFDSVMFLISLKNAAWPCGKMMSIYTESGQTIVIPLDNTDCAPPDISDLEKRIFLVNKVGDRLQPALVWGKHMNFLTANEEFIFVKFDFPFEGRHFLSHSDEFDLNIVGFEKDIRLTLFTRYMK